jgi:hypothetical protein
MENQDLVPEKRRRAEQEKFKLKAKPIRSSAWFGIFNMLSLAGNYISATNHTIKHLQNLPDQKPEGLLSFLLDRCI